MVSEFIFHQTIFTNSSALQLPPRDSDQQQLGCSTPDSPTLSQPRRCRTLFLPRFASLINKCIVAGNFLRRLHITSNLHITGKFRSERNV